MKHIISAKQFELPDVMAIMEAADLMRDPWHRLDPLTVARGRVMATLFYEPSTRTRLSFESAMGRLGGHVISTENAREFSSTIKGESLSDTIRVVSAYADVIVLRHPDKGSSGIATKYSDVPILNAGDGDGDHPTQALLDIYTIGREMRRFNDIKISLIGDLFYGRTIHSLIYLLSLFEGIEVQLVSPSHLALPKEYLDHLKANGVRFHATSEMSEVVKWKPQLIYMTRVQKERMGFKSIKEKATPYVINKNFLSKLSPNCVIMHPLPRCEEISKTVDDDTRAAYFRQVQNGLYVRMGILFNLFNQGRM